MTPDEEDEEKERLHEALEEVERYEREMRVRVVYGPGADTGACLLGAHIATTIMHEVFDGADILPEELYEQMRAIGLTPELFAKFSRSETLTETENREIEKKLHMPVCQACLRRGAIALMVAASKMLRVSDAVIDLTIAADEVKGEEGE